MTQDRPFTMGFEQALQYGIDYRDYEKERELPQAGNSNTKNGGVER